HRDGENVPDGRVSQAPQPSRDGRPCRLTVAEGDGSAPIASFGERLDWARRNTRGFAGWKRRVLAAVTVAVAVVVALRLFGSGTSARDELIVAVATAAATLVILPLGEFVWNLARAGEGIAIETIRRLDDQLVSTTSEYERCLARVRVL